MEHKNKEDNQPNIWAKALTAKSGIKYADESLIRLFDGCYQTEQVHAQFTEEDYNKDPQTTQGWMKIC